MRFYTERYKKKKTRTHFTEVSDPVRVLRGAVYKSDKSVESRPDDFVVVGVELHKGGWSVAFNRGGEYSRLAAECTDTVRELKVHKLEQKSSKRWISADVTTTKEPRDSRVDEW